MTPVCSLNCHSPWEKNSSHQDRERTQLRLPSPVIPANILALLCSNPSAWALRCECTWALAAPTQLIYYCSYLLLLAFSFLLLSLFCVHLYGYFLPFLAISLLPHEATLDFETLKLPNLCPPYQRSCLRLTANLGQVH